MTAAVHVLADLVAAGVMVTLDGSRLQIDAPTGFLTPNLLDQLRWHKPALVALLGGPDATGRRWSQPVGPAYGWRPDCTMCRALADITRRAIPCGRCAAERADAQRAARQRPMAPSGAGGTQAPLPLTREPAA